MGGKGEELSLIKSLLPQSINRVIEPFAGSAVVAFDLEKDTILNDLNRDVMNLYEVIADEILYPQLMNRLNPWLNYHPVDDKLLLEQKYYEWREYLNKKDYSDRLAMAEAYLFVRQMCHRGLQRENSKGKFNVAFGHGRKFGTCLDDKHHQFLKNNVKLMQGDFESCIDLATVDDWIFVDPPYLQTQDYNGKDFNEEDHRRLAYCLSKTSAKWLLIHLDCDLYRELYSDYEIQEEDFVYKMQYGVNGKKKPSKVKHLYIRNY